MWEIFVPSSQFCGERKNGCPKKNKVFKKWEKTVTCYPGINPTKDEQQLYGEFFFNFMRISKKKKIDLNGGYMVTSNTLGGKISQSMNSLRSQ